MINLGETQNQKPQLTQSRCAIHQPGRDLCLPPLEEQHRRGCSSSAVLSQPRAPQNLGPEIKRAILCFTKECSLVLPSPLAHSAPSQSKYLKAHETTQT